MRGPGTDEVRCIVRPLVYQLYTFMFGPDTDEVQHIIFVLAYKLPLLVAEALMKFNVLWDLCL